jgi:hypothetical protein
MSELTFAGAGGDTDRAIDLDAAARESAGIFFETVRVVEEKDTQDGAHPIEVKAWVLDGEQAGAHDPSMWIFPKGMRDKLNKEPGGRSAGQLEIYKGRGNREFIGLTSMSAEQRKLAQAKNEELNTGGSAAKAAPDTAKDEPPF